VKKLSWPPYSDLNLMEDDIAMDSNHYDTFVGEGKSTTSDSEELEELTMEDPPGYSEGMMFPVDDLFQDQIDSEEYFALESMSKRFLNLIKKESTILSVGKQTDKSASIILKEGHNLINLSKDASNKVNIHKFHQEYGDPMFHTFRRKFDGFCIASSQTAGDSLEIILNNIYNHLRPISNGLIILKNSSDFSSNIEKIGFKIIDKHINKVGKYLVSKNDSNKTAIVRCYNKEDNVDASVVFRCDIAKSFREKVDGLQTYSRLDKESGLLFPYNRPTDVFYHMGSVSYPIDIIFINENFKIKKISKNIQPGSLEVFGCHGVKYVLEISGGLSDVLGIKESNSIYIEQGADFDDDLLKIANTIKNSGVDKYIFKRSSVLKSGFYNILNNKIYVINNNENQHSVTQIIKNASLNYESENKIVAFDIDNLFLNNNFKIKLYKHAAPDDDKRIFIGLHNEVFSADKNSFIEVDLSDIVSKGFYEKINSTYSVIPNESMRYSDIDNKERDKALEKICETALDSKKRIVFVSRKNNDRIILENFLEKEIEIKKGLKTSISSDLVRVPEDYGSKDIFKALKEKYSENNIELYSDSLVKSAGIPVPDDIKSKAKHALRYFDRSKDMCDTLIENFNKNLAAYEKVQGNKDVISNSKGKYNQSVKRNSRITKRMLINIKNGIKILNDIKDISTTSEIINIIADSSKASSEAVKEVFDLINILDTDDFINQCTQKTQNSENVIDDLKMALSRAKEYINSDILGILILSE
tara:strand:- start:5723 stop:7993 length:2271 start_codon:yes stop_codon:yes gene_type:complete